MLTGKPTESSCYECADAAWEHLTEACALCPEAIVPYGCSIGTGQCALGCCSVQSLSGVWQDWQWTSPHGARKMLHVCNRHVRLCGGVGGQVHRGRAHPAGTPSPTCSAHDARMVADFA